jgi:hypothetical protein
VDQTFSAHRTWNHTPYQLSLDGKSGVDHTNPSSWVGDVVVGGVNLSACWLQGQSVAANILQQAGVPFPFDPTALSADSLEIDLMRPAGLYPGIQVDNTELDTPAVSILEFTDNPALVDTSTFRDPNDFLHNCQTAPGHLDNDELHMERLLPPTSDDPMQSHVKRGRLSVEDEPVHIESTVRYLLGTDSATKSTDHLRCVCGYTQYLHPADSWSNSVLGNDFHISELVATFLCVKNQLVLAIIRVTDIMASDGPSFESIADKHFADHGITLSGQLLELESDAGAWYWTQRYDLAVCTLGSAHRERRLGFDFGAHFARPINPALVERNREPVWVFDRRCKFYTFMCCLTIVFY